MNSIFANAPWNKKAQETTTKYGPHSQMRDPSAPLPPNEDKIWWQMKDIAGQYEQQIKQIPIPEAKAEIEAAFKRFSQMVDKILIKHKVPSGFKPPESMFLSPPSSPETGLLYSPPSD